MNRDSYRLHIHVFEQEKKIQGGEMDAFRRSRRPPGWYLPGGFATVPSI